jgi:hypothetical protein
MDKSRRATGGFFCGDNTTKTSTWCLRDERSILTMMRGANSLGYLLGFILGMSVHTLSSGENSYQSIVERNVFGLNPAKVDGPPAEPAVPPPKITLTGITTLLGNKRALLSVQVPNKPLETYILTEGQRDGEIEILQIDEKAGTVKVSNHGVEQILDFLTAGAKLQPSPVPVLPPPGTSPAPTNGSGGPAPARTIPTRSLRLPPIPGGPTGPVPNSPNPLPPS